VHNDLSSDIKNWEDKFMKEENRCAELKVENQNLMNRLDKIESEFKLANDTYHKTCIKLNEAMKSNNEKDIEIDKLNLLIKDMNLNLTSSTISNINEYNLSITINKDIFNKKDKVSNDDQFGLKDSLIFNTNLK
jgi:predicted RNase H-like nuclease (RuvC/YqgF family)